VAHSLLLRVEEGAEVKANEVFDVCEALRIKNLPL